MSLNRSFLMIKYKIIHLFIKSAFGERIDELGEGENGVRGHEASPSSRLRVEDHRYELSFATNLLKYSI